MKILVAEDDRISRLFLQMLLKKLGHTVTACEDGALAWQAYQGAINRIVISDWMMPHLDGIELCRNIRKLNPPHQCDFIIAAVRAGEGDFLAAIKAAPTTYLMKPVNKDDVAERLNIAQKILTLTRLRRPA